MKRSTVVVLAAFTALTCRRGASPIEPQESRECDQVRLVLGAIENPGVLADAGLAEGVSEYLVGGKWGRGPGGLRVLARSFSDGGQAVIANCRGMEALTSTAVLDGGTEYFGLSLVRFEGKQLFWLYPGMVSDQPGTSTVPFCLPARGVVSRAERGVALRGLSADEAAALDAPFMEKK